MFHLVHHQDAHGNSRIDVDGNQNPYSIRRKAGDVSNGNADLNARGSQNFKEGCNNRRSAYRSDLESPPSSPTLNPLP